MLADRTVRGLSPEGWAQTVVQAAADYGASTVVVEVNQGGELVTGLLRAVGAGLEIKGVRASVGKPEAMAMRTVLLEMAKDPDGAALLKRLNIDGFIPGDTRLYDKVVRLQRAFGNQ